MTMAKYFVTNDLILWSSNFISLVCVWLRDRERETVAKLTAAGAGREV